MLTRALLVGSLLAAALSAAPATASTAGPCVLLLGSYPAEVSANLALMTIDPHQPTTLDGHELYAGTLAGRRVVTGIAGPSPALTGATTTLALKHWKCINAVVFTGTAGGAGPAQLGDVAVPSRWTGDEGHHYTKIDAQALALAKRTAAQAAKQLGTMAAVNDGPCACEAVVESVKAVPLGRTPRVVVGGNGVTFGGDSNACYDQGGMLAGCNPCPPGSTSLPALVVLHLTPAQAARSARTGLVPDAVPDVGALARRAPRPGGTVGNSSTSYIADDMQTTASLAAARARHVPFIAFRGISDTDSVGNLWPFEYLVYQGLAADNAAAAARVWIAAWNAR
jgi:nucleoside phosphorylase